LPADQREVVHLKVFEGMTFQEIADLDERVDQHRREPVSLRHREAASSSDMNDLDDPLRGYRPAGPCRICARESCAKPTERQEQAFATGCRRWLPRRSSCCSPRLATAFNAASRLASPFRTI